MASFNIEMGDIFDESAYDDLFKEAIEECSEPLATNTKSALSSVSRSDLASKVKATKAKKQKSGAWTMSAYPQGKTSDGTSAATAAFYLHYGTSNPGGRGRHQPARPWADKATANAESACLKAIEKKHDEILKKQGLI